MNVRIAAVLLLGIPVVAGGQIASDAPTSVFSGEVSSGSWLRIRNLRGTIEVQEARGRNAVVAASRRLNRASGDEITFEVLRDGSNVTICAISRRTRRCDAEGYDIRSDNNDRTTGRADFTVSLPRGVRLLAATGNGDIHIRNAGSEVDASSGNGDVSVLKAGGRVNASSGNGEVQVQDAGGRVRASTGNGDVTVSTSAGPVSASSGNGRIDVRMATLPADGDMSFTTGNGSVILSFPSNLSAVIDANVAFKNLDTDFPMSLPSRWNSSRIQGTIGNGGRRIRISTGNGRVSIRKNT
ncbi:MAG TPA: DUF4097 family beta strand repeat-containing protein [Gemmatimonadaceae bacterium]|nr:DUF4097 family beta strand repeat-containing protein [Gemmatimonadaceae bacterium]